MDKTFVREYLRRVYLLISKRQLIGTELYKIIENDEFIKLLHENAIKHLFYLIRNSDKDPNKDLIYISLFLIALLNYDGNYWDHVREKYRILEAKYDIHRQTLERVIRKLLRDYGNELIQDGRIINVALCNAFVPINYLGEFYSIVMDILTYDFQLSLPEDDNELDEVLNTIFYQIASKEYSEDDAFKSAALNKSYKLIKSTRDVINSTRYRRQFVRFVKEVLRSLESIVLIDSSNKSEVSYLNKYAEKWFEENREHNERVLSDESHKRPNKLRWKPELKLVDGSTLHLYTRTVFLSHDVDHSLIKIKIMSDDKVVYQNDRPEIIDIALSTELSSEEIRVDWSPFSMKYTVEGLSEKEVLYVRKVYVFNDLGDEVQSNYGSHDMLRFVVPNSIEKTNAELEIRCNYYSIYNVYTTEMDYVYFDQYKIALDKVVSPVLKGDVHKNIYVKLNESEMGVYASDISLLYPLRSNTDAMILSVNDKKKRLDLDQDQEVNVVSVPNLRSGINHVELLRIDDQGNLSKVKSWTIIYDPSLSYDLQKQNEDTYTVTVNSEQYENKSKKASYDYNPTEESYFTVDFQGYTLVFDLPIPMLKRESSDYTLIESFIWHDEVNYYELVTIKGMFAKKLNVVGKKTGELYKSFYPEETTHKTCFKFDLGILKTLDPKENLTLEFVDNTEIVATIDFLNQNEIMGHDVSLDYKEDTNELTLELKNYVGKNEMDVKLFHYDDLIKKVVIDELPFRTNFNQLNSFHEYILKIQETRTKISLFTAAPYYFQRQDAVGQDFKITEVYTDITNRKNYKTYQKISRPYRTYLTIKSYDKENNEYIAKIYYEKSYGMKKYFSQVKEVKLIIENSGSKTFNASIYDLDNEMLYFDPNKNHIIDHLDPEKDYKAIGTIYDYTIKKR